MKNDSTVPSDPAPSEADVPAIILVGPQIGENIGAVARAMLNCGLEDLRLVRPREGWPNPKAQAMASGADRVLEAARLYPTVEEAVADLHRVYATTARRRDMVKPVLTPRQAVIEIHQQAREQKRSGVLFGPERIGLINEELTLADVLLTVPLNPEFTSLNLAQAVLLIAYEWFQAGDETPGRYTPDTGAQPATREELFGFFGHLEEALDKRRFFKTPQLRPSMVKNLRNLFHRAELTEQEVRTLHGVITALCGKPRHEL